MYREKAIKWFEKGTAEQDYIDKFIYLWIAFNALYNSIEFIGNERERVVAHIVGNYNTQLYEKIFKSSYVKTFMVKPVINVYKPNQDLEEFIFYKLKYSIKNKEKMQMLFNTIYRVRCNLFHGSKTPDSYRDNDLIKNAGAILQIYLNYIFSNTLKGEEQNVG